MMSGEQVVGVLALHVDDEIGGGTEEFHGVMAKIGETLAVGSHDTSNSRYKGLRVSTVFKEEQTVIEINVDGDDYLASCRAMDVPLGEDTDLLPPQSMTDYANRTSQSNVCRADICSTCRYTKFIVSERNSRRSSITISFVESGLISSTYCSKVLMNLRTFPHTADDALSSSSRLTFPSRAPTQKTTSCRMRAVSVVTL
jgi:hypothetical protein